MSADQRNLARVLDWDSNFFGFRIAQAVPDRLTEPLASDAVAWCAANDVRCLYFLAAPGDPETESAAGKYGFHPVDVRVTMDRDLNDAIPAPQGPIRPHRAGDLPALRDIAAVSHRDSRFYFDGRFPRERCDALYRTWIERSCQGYAREVLVAERHSEPVGYITCHLSDDGAGSIGLIAVGEGARGAGAGRDLVNASLDWFARNNAASVTVVTQERNAAAQRLYGGCRFRTRATAIWYHYWRPDPK